MTDKAVATPATNFSHFADLAVDETITAEYVIHDISVNGVHPVLFVKTSSFENQAYKNAQIRHTGKLSQVALARGKITPGFVDEQKEMDRHLYAKYVITGWKDMYNAKGEEVVYSKEEASNLMQMMPGWMFDELRGFCSNPDNFNKGDGHIEVKTKAKKSVKTLPGT